MFGVNGGGEYGRGGEMCVGWGLWKGEEEEEEKGWDGVRKREKEKHEVKCGGVLMWEMCGGCLSEF